MISVIIAHPSQFPRFSEAQALNAGMRRAKGSVFAWITGDVSTSRKQVERLLREFKKKPRLAAMIPAPGAGKSDCVLVKRRAARAVGLLDERLAAGPYPFWDYALRLKMAGYGIAFPREAACFLARAPARGEGAGVRPSREAFARKWAGLPLDFLDPIDSVLAAGPARP